MTKKGWRNCCLLAALLAAGLFPRAEARAEEGKGYRKVFDSWALVCSEAEPKAGKCQIVQALDVKQESGEAKRLLQASVGRLEGGKLYLHLTLPLGVDLRPGAVVRVGEGEQVNIPFTTCLANGCQALVAMPDLLVHDFRKRAAATIGFRPWNSQKTAQVQLSLKGFAQALTALP